MDKAQWVKNNRQKIFGVNNIDFRLLRSKKDFDLFGIKKNGSVKFMNRICNRYLVNYREKGLKGEIYEWNNILLRMRLEYNSIVSVTEAYVIDTKPKFSATLFNLPNNVEILDLTNRSNH